MFVVLASPFRASTKATLAFSSTESGQVVEVKKSTILCSGPQFIQDFKRLAHGQFEVGWVAHGNHGDEMHYKRFGTLLLFESALSICRRNLSQNHPKIKRQNSTNDLYQSIHFLWLCFQALLLPSDQHDLKRIVGEPLVDRGV